MMNSMIQAAHRIERRGNDLGVFPLAALALCLMAGALQAAPAVTFDVQPRRIRLPESAAATFTVKGIPNPPRPDLPRIDGLRIAGSGTQQSLRFVNGRQERSITFSYRITPTKPGTYTLGPYTYRADGEEYDLPAVTLEVVAPGGSGPDTQGRETPWSEQLFARLDIPRTNLYVQELFDATLTIYARDMNLGREMSILGLPESGLNMQGTREMRAGRDIIGGKVYDAQPFKVRFRALTEGTFVLEPTIRVNRLVRRQQRSRSPFSDPFFDSFFNRVEKQPVDVPVDPITVRVHPLPQTNQPPTFAGAVGRYNFSVEVKPVELRAGDPITIRMAIRGQGNLDTVTAPDLQAPRGFNLYDPKLVERDVHDGGTAGRKVFEQVVIPQSGDIRELPAIAFSFFDPEAETYRTITQGPFPLVIEDTGAGAAPRVVGGGDRPAPSLQVLGTDIAYLKPAPGDWRRADRTPWFLRPMTWLLQGLPVVGLAAVWLFTRRRAKLTRDVAFARRRQAPRRARRAFRTAERIAATESRRGFYEAVWLVLSAYFGDRFNLSPGEVTRDRVLAAMGGDRLPDDLRRHLQTLFDQCEAERFAAGGGQDRPPSDEAEQTERRQVLDHLREVLKRCEKVRVSPS